MLDKWKQRMEILSRIKPYTEKLKLKFMILFVISILEMLLVLFIPLLYGVFVDEVIMEGKMQILKIVIVGYILVQSGQILIMFGKNYYRNEIANTVSVRIKEKIINNFLEKTFKEMDNLDKGNAKMILDEDMIKLDAFVDTQTINYVLSEVKCIIVFGILVFIDWRLSMLAFIITPITFLLDNKIAKHSKIVNEEQRQNYSKWTNWLHQTIENWREVKALSLDEYEKNEFNRYCRINAKYFTIKTRWWVMQSMILPKIKNEFLMQFLLYFCGGILIYGAYITIGALLAFSKYYLIFLQTLQGVSKTNVELIENMNFYTRVLEAAEKVRIQDKLCQDRPNNYHIEFRNVSFCYPGGEKNIIENFNLKILTGERIGIIGESGKGKTTILRLMMGLYNPQKGEILFGERDLRQWNRKVIFSHIGFVMQENMLYNVSIRENLFYGKDNATQKELEDACKKAYILDFINSLENGFDTIIGERGIKLSGGQKQRLVLARLFLRDVDVFILDEATSALDQYAENLVQQAIESIDKEKTVIVVSHRNSSLQLCNRIVSI